MRTRDNLTLTALNAAHQFLQDYGDRSQGLRESPLRAQLDGILSTIRSHLTAQVVHRMNRDRLVRTQGTLGLVLRRDHLRPIVRTARADLPHTPEFRVLRMPAGRPNIDRLVSAASAMTGIAERFADTFVAVGLPPTFVDDLRAAIRALLAARDEATLERGKRHGATAGIEAAMVQGRRILRDLDKLVASELRRDPPLVAHWRTVTARPRLGRPRNPRKKRPDDPEA
jgi:hypothetical protein